MDDQEITHLVDDKVDAFWRGVEGDANKRGQVRAHTLPRALSRTLTWCGRKIVVTFSEKRPQKSWFLSREVC